MHKTYVYDTLLTIQFAPEARVGAEQASDMVCILTLQVFISNELKPSS